MPQYYNYNYPYYTTPWYNPYQYGGGYGMQYGYGYPYSPGYYRDDSEDSEYEDDSRVWGRRPWGWGFGRPWGWGFGRPWGWGFGRPFFGFGFGSPFFF